MSETSMTCNAATIQILPVRWGGLGVRGVVLLALSTFLASAANTSELTSALLPPRLRDVEGTGFDADLAAWTMQATNSSKGFLYAGHAAPHN